MDAVGIGGMTVKSLLGKFCASFFFISPPFKRFYIVPRKGEAAVTLLQTRTYLYFISVCCP